MNEHERFQVEEVDGVETPPRARVEDAESPAEKLGRKRDYLEGFLAKQPQKENPAEPGGALYESVVDALKEIYDPEIPVNIYDLGLIYGVDVGPEADVMVTMTLTTPHCPMGPQIIANVEQVLQQHGASAVTVNIVWQPAWTPYAMTEALQRELGILEDAAAQPEEEEPLYIPPPEPPRKKGFFQRLFGST
jgi:metal-sulfur cluster biosynthetic enzyme